MNRFGNSNERKLFCDLLTWTGEVRSPTGAEEFSSSLSVQTGCGPHPASCTVGTGSSFPGDKGRPGRDADHSPPSSAEVKKEWELYLSPRAPPWRVAGPVCLLNFYDLLTSQRYLRTEMMLPRTGRRVR
jgi:hypothetical protein